MYFFLRYFYIKQLPADRGTWTGNLLKKSICIPDGARTFSLKV
jgi:hypothetical protein